MDHVFNYKDIKNIFSNAKPQAIVLRSEDVQDIQECANKKTYKSNNAKTYKSVETKNKQKR